MGVKSYFMLNTGSAVLMGPAVFFKLAERYVSFYQQGYMSVPIEKRLQGTTSWRARVRLLYIHLKPLTRDSYSLEELKVRNPRRDQRYIDGLRWIRQHSTKPITPPTLRQR